MTKVNYRTGTEKDFPAVAEMYLQLDAFYRELTYNWPQPEDVADVWIESFRRTLGRFSNLFVAEVADEIVGFQLARVKRVPAFMGGVMVGENTDKWIRPDVRRLGIGIALSRMGLDWLFDQGVHSIEIRILEGNDPSWKLYQRFGFQPEMRQYRLFREDYRRDA